MSEKLEPLDLLKELSAAKARLAFFTTFTLDLAFFEAEVFEVLQAADKDVQAIVLADRMSYLETALAGRFVRKAESEYRLFPFTPTGPTFHPKVIFLAGNDWARLYVGSGNVTRPGFARNLEIFDRIETSTAAPAHAACFKSFAEFMKQLAKPSGAPANASKSLSAVIEAAERFSNGPDDGEIVFGSTFQRSLLEDLKRHPISNCRDILVASPFHDPDNSALTELGEL